MRLPARWAPFLTGFFMSLFMVFIITAVLNLMSGHPSFADWVHSFVRVWPIAFVAVIVVMPLVRRVVLALTQPPLQER
ncbi:DUF2798 domain-containing protein [Noviherbaspirillum sp.]|uniref:DUF2798 domain-containing protein n=1 Tax=Noviherbaspirillum sp. TaxID=1926288 RepID=UPI002B4A4E50|nr:DUF2798 domain-containing protein [Noviherbaspirillum sp.]HJV81562.1 DUF2798 domain-containing protein [Noviherbaspirillum sp.]